MKTFRSALSGAEYPVSEKIPASSIRRSIFEFICQANPGFKATDSLSVRELNTYREKYILNYISKQIGELTTIEQTVLDSISEKVTLTDKLDEDDRLSLSFGQRMADKVAAFGGSWRFIVSFGVFLLVWISVNIFCFSNTGFDPYPFILLNLLLSCVAALQAPIIMMSQNRQEEGPGALKERLYDQS